MPVVVASSTRSADALINYALEDKPDQRGERYVMASGVGGMLVSVAKQQMRDVRKKWGKDKPGAFVQAYHVIQSFAKDELDPERPDAWMTAQRLGRALAEERFPGRQVLVVTQRDGRTGCVHNHLVANAVDAKTGRSVNSSIITHARLVEAHERVLKEQDFTQRADLRQAFSDAKERQERGERSGLRRAGSAENSELRELQHHFLWETECDLADEFGGPRRKQPFSLTVLKHSIEVTLADPAAVDWESFVTCGKAHGVLIELRGRKGRGISYGMLREEPDGTLAEPAASDRRRCTTLGSAFEMDAIEAMLLLKQATPAPTPQRLPAQAMSTERARMAAALREADEEADAMAKRMLADFLARKRDDDTQRRDDRRRDDQRATGAPRGVEEIPSIEAVSRALDDRVEDELQQADATAAEEERSETTRPSGAPKEPQATPRQAPRKPRPLRLRFPELAHHVEMDDTEVSPSGHDWSLGD